MFSITKLKRNHIMVRNSKTNKEEFVVDKNVNYCNVPNNGCQRQVLAIARVEKQIWQKIYEPEKAFCRGTIFCQLDLPFRCEEGCR